MSIAATGFMCGVFMAAATLVQTKGDVDKSAACGAAFTMATIAFGTAFSLFTPELREIKYIDERTEESN